VGRIAQFWVMSWHSLLWFWTEFETHVPIAVGTGFLGVWNSQPIPIPQQNLWHSLVWGRCLKLDLYPYLPSLYPGTCVGLQICAMHYWYVYRWIYCSISIGSSVTHHTMIWHDEIWEVSHCPTYNWRVWQLIDKDTQIYAKNTTITLF